MLCPFNDTYDTFFTNTLGSIISGNTGDLAPERMMDLRSPRLVGQALYERIRWSTRCLVDWTYWRANVLFERRRPARLHPERPRVHHRRDVGR